MNQYLLAVHHDWDAPPPAPEARVAAHLTVPRTATGGVARTRHFARRSPAEPPAVGQAHRDLLQLRSGHAQLPQQERKLSMADGTTKRGAADASMAAVYSYPRP